MERHLLPNEIDLLVDGEVGFGVAPLRAHAAECADCRVRVAEGRAVVEALEGVPHFAPSPMFTEKVMSRVEVFVPWHVAALDTVRRLIPTSRPARALVAAVAGSVALVLTLGTLWVAYNATLVKLAAELVTERVGGALLAAVGGVVSTIFGPDVFATLRAAGPVALIGVSMALLALTAGVAVGMRLLAGAASRRRS